MGLPWKRPCQPSYFQWWKSEKALIQWSWLASMQKYVREDSPSFQIFWHVQSCALTLGSSPHSTCYSLNPLNPCLSSHSPFGLWGRDTCRAHTDSEYQLLSGIPIQVDVHLPSIASRWMDGKGETCQEQGPIGSSPPLGIDAKGKTFRGIGSRQIQFRSSAALRLVIVWYKMLK